MPKLHMLTAAAPRRRRLFPSFTVMTVLLVAAGLNIPAIRHISTFTPPLFHAAVSPFPAVLSPSDMDHYREAFAARQAGQPEKADREVAQVADPLLKPVLSGEPPVTHALKGFSNGQDRSALPEEKHWVSGLAAFRRGDMAVAASHFKVLLDEDDNTFSCDDRAAIAFWAYRASIAVNDNAQAAKYLALAASQSPGFYSILARQISGQRAIDLADTQPDDMEAFLHNDAVRRAIALKSIGQDSLAEKELRALFPSSTAQNRRLLVQVARMLNLPATQIRMAAEAAYDTVAADALYPMPRWTPTSGYSVEPALLFAIMRQESGFNPNAKSASGAIGVMQLMPATAHAMARDARLKLTPEPAVSMTLGQHYLERLMDISAIHDNLIYLIAAYNAGPGTVEAWQKKIHINDDPLLFIESIPWSETRDYVVRVTGNYWVYSEMMGQENNPSAAALAQNHWPHYERSDRQVALMVNRLSNSGTE